MDFSDGFLLNDLRFAATNKVTAQAKLGQSLNCAREKIVQKLSIVTLRDLKSSVAAIIQGLDLEGNTRIEDNLDLPSPSEQHLTFVGKWKQMYSACGVGQIKDVFIDHQDDLIQVLSRGNTIRMNVEKHVQYCGETIPVCYKRRGLVMIDCREDGTHLIVYKYKLSSENFSFSSIGRMSLPALPPYFLERFRVVFTDATKVRNAPAFHFQVIPSCKERRISFSETYTPIIRSKINQRLAGHIQQAEVF